MTNRPPLQSKFLGSVVGLALGDAIGEMAFGGFEEAALRRRVVESDALIYTDDTAMAIGLAESVAKVGRIDQQHLGDTFRGNFRREPWRGYASGPPTIFRTVERRGIPYVDAARGLFGGQGSFGNGAAMRVAPVGCFFHEAPDLYEQARLSAMVTHAHPIGIDGAAVLAKAVAQAVRLDPATPFPLEESSQSLIDFAGTPEIRGKMVLARELVCHGVSPAQAIGQLGRSVAVHESMPFAVYSFLRYPHSFDGCLFCAILHGGDRDTLGAMACGISGAYLGIEAIPSEWRARLENREYIEDLARRLAKAAAL
jgi:poly(ADP-ribose) glycohydrolase ARH3